MSFDANAFIAQLIPPPVHRFLGGRFEQFDADQLRLKLSYQSRAEFANPAGALTRWFTQRHA